MTVLRTITAIFFLLSAMFVVAQISSSALKAEDCGPGYLSSSGDWVDNCTKKITEQDLDYGDEEPPAEQPDGNEGSDDGTTKPPTGELTETQKRLQKIIEEQLEAQKNGGKEQSEDDYDALSQLACNSKEYKNYRDVECETGLSEGDCIVKKQSAITVPAGLENLTAKEYRETASKLYDECIKIEEEEEKALLEEAVEEACSEHREHIDDAGHVHEEKTIDCMEQEIEALRDSLQEAQDALDEFAAEAAGGDKDKEDDLGDILDYLFGAQNQGYSANNFPNEFTCDDERVISGFRQEAYQKYLDELPGILSEKMKASLSGLSLSSLSSSAKDAMYEAQKISMSKVVGDKCYPVGGQSVGSGPAFPPNGTNPQSKDFTVTEDTIVDNLTGITYDGKTSRMICLESNWYNNVKLSGKRPTHSDKDKFCIVYYANGEYNQEAMARLDYASRDLFEETTKMDERLWDIMSKTCATATGNPQCQNYIFCVTLYRGERHNNLLKNAVKNSRHKVGAASDCSMAGVNPATFYNACVAVDEAQESGWCKGYKKIGHTHFEVGVNWTNRRK